MAGYGLTKPDHLSEALKSELKNLNIENRLQFLSMGMSSDYVEALKSGSNFIRVGSAIFSVI